MLHAQKLGVKDLATFEAGNEAWYCRNCEAHCGHCSRMVLYCHKAVQYGQCELWIHNECSLISQSEYEALENSRTHIFILSATWKVQTGLNLW